MAAPHATDIHATDVDAIVAVRVLGEIAISVNGTPVELQGGSRATALLGWLAINAGPRHRSEIASALWPDVPDSSARNSVRTALWSLRQALGAHADAVLDSSRDRVGFRAADIDFQRFEELAGAEQVDGALAVAASGKLLSGLEDEWAILAREAHRDRVIALLMDSSNAAAAAGDHELALTRARRAAEQNPLSESCARLLMRRCEENGDRSVALGVYARIVDRLRRELKIAPSEETWKLAESIRSRQRNEVRHTEPASGGGPGDQREGQARLIGREQELAVLERAWSAARAGTGGVVIMHGEAGIGKTRLITELTAMARRDGAIAATGTTSSMSCTPYGPWAEVAGALLRALGGIPEHEPFAGAVAQLLPSHIQPVAPGPPEFEQARLTGGLLGLLEFAATRAPLLVVLEDMHAGDDLSAAVLARAARMVADLRVLLVWTRRNRPIAPMLAEAERTAAQSGAVLAQVNLERLGVDSISAIAKAVGALDDTAVSTIVVAAEGNPLLAVEAARAFARGDVSLALGLRSYVCAARAHLPAAAQSLCAVLAVAGRATSVDDVRRRMGPCDDTELDAAFDDAHDAGLLRVTEGMLDFRHALLRDAYHAELPELLRARLHTVTAHDIDCNGAPELAGEAARHLLAAGDQAGAAGLLVRAAQHAVSLAALDRAEELLTEALELKPADLAIMLELAEVAAHRGTAAECQARFERAIESLDRTEDPVGFAAAHIRCAEWNTGPLCRPHVARESVGLALETLDTAGVSAIRLRLEAQAFMALCEAMAGDPAVADQLLDAIDAQCRRLPAEPIRDIRRHVARSLAQMRQGRFDEVAESGRAAAAIARSIGRQDLMYGSLVNAAAGLAATGAYGDALGLLDEIGAIASSGTLPLATEAEVQMSRAWLMSRLGRHAEAARVAQSATRLARRIGAPELLASADAETGRVLLRAGLYADAADLLARALEVPAAAISRPLARLQRAEALARSGRLADARTELSAVALEPVGPGDWPDILVAKMLMVRALVHAAEGDIAAAEKNMQRCAAGWRRRMTDSDAGKRYSSVLADLGRPVIGLISPADELDAVLAELVALQTSGGNHADI